MAAEVERSGRKLLIHQISQQRGGSFVCGFVIFSVILILAQLIAQY
jgi:hypothetical protein